jgi:hypothetical protein
MLTEGLSNDRDNCNVETRGYVSLKSYIIHEATYSPSHKVILLRLRMGGSGQLCK